MKQTITTIRIFFLLLMILGSWLITMTISEWHDSRWVVIAVGGLMGVLVILVDMLLKGFSLRGLSALSFGLFIGWLMAWFISSSPLFEEADSGHLFLARMAVFVILMYLGAVIALRGKDEFHLVIPYVRFVPHQVTTPLAVIDTSALIDGRILGICQSRFMGYALVVPTFVIDELHHIADSKDPFRQARGRKGLEVLNALRKLDFVDLRTHNIGLDRNEKVDTKIVALAQSLKARLMTTDFNLAQIAEFNNVEWLNINALSKALNPELITGETLEVDLVKGGKEVHQGVGYLSDGSMVVVNDARSFIGQRIWVEVQGILPSAGGKMVFARHIHRSGSIEKGS
jgi:uncharacterized protein YacL